MAPKKFQPVSLTPGFSRMLSSAIAETILTVSPRARELLKQFSVLLVLNHPAEAGC
jgi:hypothetical protein